MDDAHDNIVHDREITRRSFDYAIWESKARLFIATSNAVLSFLVIFACLFSSTLWRLVLWVSYSNTDNPIFHGP